jgi:hypothetical protein
VSAYDNDHRVQRHWDGSWIVFGDDAEFAVYQRPDGPWNSFDADGRPLAAASGMASMDDAIRALVGEPQ